MLTNIPTPFDLSVSQAIQAWQPHAWTVAMRGVSAIFSPAMLVTVTIIIAVLFVLQRKYATLALALAITAGNGLTIILKPIFGEPRPSANLVHVLAHETDLSFPSGHAIAIILFCAALYAYFPPQRLGAKTWWAAISLAAVLFVGYSRLYLGVHWFRDVLAGYGVALLWAGGVWRTVPKIWQRFFRPVNLDQVK